MHDLILKYFTGDLTLSERKKLFSTLQTDGEAKKEFAEMQNIFAVSSFSFFPPEKEKASESLKQFNRLYRKKSFSLFLRRVSGYAAAILLSVLSTYLIMKNSLTSQNDQATYEEFSTPAGQRAMLKLYDGTVVWLNACSTLRYPNNFADDERKVQLEGEAYFEVQKNKEVPFIVETQKADIKVIGTKFNVFAYPGQEEFHTSLLDGSVKVYGKNDEKNALMLKPQEYAYFTETGLAKKHFDNHEFLLWKEGIYAFYDLPFFEIAKKLELYYDVTFIIHNASLKTFKYTGKFRQRDGVESVLRTLQKVYPFTYIKDDEKNCITLK